MVGRPRTPDDVHVISWLQRELQVGISLYITPSLFVVGNVVGLLLVASKTCSFTGHRPGNSSAAACCDNVCSGMYVHLWQLHIYSSWLLP